MSHEPSDAEVNAFIAANPSGCTLDQIAEELHCSKQRVGQIINSAIGKIQRELRWRQIRSPWDVIPSE